MGGNSPRVGSLRSIGLIIPGEMFVIRNCGFEVCGGCLAPPCVHFLCVGGVGFVFAEAPLFQFALRFS